eukprot:g1514.t1
MLRKFALRTILLILFLSVNADLMSAVGEEEADAFSLHFVGDGERVPVVTKSKLVWSGGKLAVGRKVTSSSFELSAGSKENVEKILGAVRIVPHAGLRIKIEKGQVKEDSVNGEWTAEIAMTYVCAESGTLSADVIIGGAALTLSKECLPGGDLAGFNIMTETQAGAVLNGVVQPQFGDGKQGEGQYMYMFSRTAKAARFSIKGPTKEEAAKLDLEDGWSVSVNVSARVVLSTFKKQRSPLRLTLDGDASLRNTEIKIGEEKLLIVRFTCRQSGMFAVELLFDTCKRPGRPLRITFRKECRVGPVPGLMVQAGEVSLGSKFLVVADGAAEPGYSESDHSAVVGVDNALLPLSVSLSRPGVKFVITKVEAVLHSEWRQGPVVRPYGILRTDVAIEPKHYDVRRWPAIEKRGSKIAEVGVIGGWRGGILSQNKTLHFSVAHDCLETGETLVMVLEWTVRAEVARRTSGRFRFFT